MKTSKLILTVFLCLGIPVLTIAASEPLIQNVPGRNTSSLNGKWNYIIDPYETGYYDYRYMPYDESPAPSNGAFYLDKKQADKTELIEYSFDKSPTLWVPGDWNSQDNRLLYYEGTIWYRRTFDYKKADASNRVFLHFGGANYESDIYLNGKKLGKHIGGFTPFNYEITGFLKSEGNSLVVKVDNKRKREAVPTLNTDWWNYGGITRDVTLVEVTSTFIQDYLVGLKKGTENEITGYVRLNGPTMQQKVRISIPELKITSEVTTDSTGKATFIFKPKNLVRWDPEHPKLYQVELTCNDRKVTDNIGFRTIETRGNDILLNGQPIFLRGICIHEENALRGGRAYSAQDAQMLLNSAKELNCNYVRLAHYPHSESMIRLADKMGILVWEEDPVYWTIQWDNPATLSNALQQLTDVITRDKNRASVIIWSMANETPVSEARTGFLKKLATRARELDNSRLISAALEIHGNPANPNERIVEDPFAEFVDIVNFNEYVGWYDGLPDKCDQIEWNIKYNKPVMISEFGGDALQGMHGDNRTRFSEEYQEDLFARTVKMLSKIPQFRGVSPWILYDFRSPKRMLPNIQDGWNRKGVICQNGNKKKAFYVLKDFYDQMELKYKH
ncbi:MAG: glycoside hydrolase family 2 TIM barrel-domain containing protein [Bacteroidota bacterium]|nr:glycoside hydrolase family 2 TIM barrel-domain containing protein [Bacteroidota bacterium]